MYRKRFLDRSAFSRSLIRIETGSISVENDYELTKDLLGAKGSSKSGYAPGISRKRFKLALLKSSYLQKIGFYSYVKAIADLAISIVRGIELRKELSY
jgi:hypothetical protein